MVTFLAIIGSCAIVWAILSTVLGLSIIVFATGSMAPTMPAGTAAIAHTVKAAELRIGDVVTVSQTTSPLPVTHRIVGIEEEADPAVRTLTLQGDDNGFADSTTYTVETVPRVVVALPGAGSFLAWMRDPRVMVGSAVLVASLVTWALWPARERARA